MVKLSDIGVDMEVRTEGIRVRAGAEWHMLNRNVLLPINSGEQRRRTGLPDACKVSAAVCLIFRYRSGSYEVRRPCPREPSLLQGAPLARQDCAKQTRLCTGKEHIRYVPRECQISRAGIFGLLFVLCQP